jgi:hypothetical protein
VSGAWSEAGAFGELRSLTSRRPSAEAFARVCALVEQAEAAAPGLYAERWAAYLAGSLERWPSSTRSVKLTSKEQAEEVARAPWSDLVRGVAIQRFLELKEAADTRWLVEEFRAEMPWLEHIGFEYTLVRKREVERACEVGVFVGLTSLGFDECDLRVPTLDVLLTHLDGLGALRRLAMTWCYMGPKQLRRLLESELIGQLEHLDLSNNRSFKVDGFAALAEAAPRFAALRTLALNGMEPPAKGMALVGGAAWPDALERIEVTGNAMGPTGLKGFVETGALWRLFGRRGEEVALNLRYQSLGNRGVKVLAGSPELAEVEALSLDWNDILDLGPLARSPYVGALRAWSLRGNESGEALAQGALELARRTRPRRLDLRECELGDAFVEGLCGMEESRELEVLLIDGYEPFGEAALEALMSWPRLDALERFSCTFEVPEGSAAATWAMRDARVQVTTRDAAAQETVMVSATWSGNG